MNLVEVALPTPLRSTFTYQHNQQESLIGKRVIVDFGRRKLVGIVIKNNHPTLDEITKCRNITAGADKTARNIAKA